MSESIALWQILVSLAVAFMMGAVFVETRWYYYTKKIEKERDQLEIALDNEREAALFWQSKARKREALKQKEVDGE